MRYKLSYLTLITLTFLAVVCASLCHSASTTYTGEVVRIIDGDTIHVKEYKSNTMHRVRLQGIDAPELDQPYGLNAKEALESVLKYRTVQVHVFNTDKYNREIAAISSKGSDISAFMLEYGYAWHYAHFDSSAFYQQLELRARTNCLGLWSGSDNVPPWLWRRKYGFYKHS